MQTLILYQNTMWYMFKRLLEQNKHVTHYKYPHIHAFAIVDLPHENFSYQKKFRTLSSI